MIPVDGTRLGQGVQPPPTLGMPREIPYVDLVSYDAVRHRREYGRRNYSKHFNSSPEIRGLHAAQCDPEG
jgi:hypothetical protein